MEAFEIKYKIMQNVYCNGNTNLYITDKQRCFRLEYDLAIANMQNSSGLKETERDR